MVENFTSFAALIVVAHLAGMNNGALSRSS